VRSLAFAVLAAILIVPAGRAGRALADPADATEAGRIFLQGRDLAKAGHYDEACALFARSYELDPALGTAVNLADCYERQGHLRRAWELFDAAARGSQDVPSRARFARDRADALVARLAAVTVRLADPEAAGLGVRIGDRVAAPAAEIHDLVEPGDVVVVATVPGRPVFKTVLHAEAGVTTAVEIPAFAAPGIATPVATRRRRSRIYLAGGLGVAGVAGLGSSLGFALSARAIYDGAFDHDCTHAAHGAACNAQGKATIDRADARADLATRLAIAGAVLVAAGATVFVTAPRDAIQIAPLATEHALGLAASGRF
jgi:tetratricopeptide (TPR) repeat protein